MLRRVIEIDENLKDDIEISFHSSEREDIDELKIKASNEAMVLTFLSYFITECVDLIGLSEEAVRKAIDVAFEKDDDEEVWECVRKNKEK